MNPVIKLYFNEPRYRLSAFGDFSVKIAVYSFYIILVVGTAVLLLSDLESLRWLGVLIGIFLVDRLIHFGQAEKSLAELARSKHKKENLALYVTPSVKRVIGYAYRKARTVGHDFYLTVLRELIDRSDVKEILKRLEINRSEFEERIDQALERSRETKDKNELLAKIENLVQESCREAVTVHERYIEVRNLLAAVVENKSPATIKLLELFNVSAADFRDAAIFGRHRRFFKWVINLPNFFGGFGRRPYRLRRRVMNRAWTAKPTPNLDLFSTDLTDLARRGEVGFLIGHDKEFERLLDVLARPTKPNALLLGEPSVGKTSLVTHLAFRLTKDLVPAALFDKRLVSLNISSLLAEATPDILASRLNTIMEEIYQAGNVILHLPDLGDFFKTGGKDSLSAVDMIMPILRGDHFPVVAETYNREFKETIEARSDVLDLFEIIRVEEISQEEAIRFLVYDSLILERNSKIFITFRAIKRAVALAHRYFRPKLLPGSAESLLKQSLIEAEHRGEKVLTENIVIIVAQEISKIPLQQVGAAEAEQLLNLEKSIHERLINQSQAVRAVAEAFRQYRSGLARRGGPIASFLFVGPTGVGKTELSKILAQIQFGAETAMIRFDMSEYQEKNTISRFLGTSEEGMVSSLTDAVLQKPYSLILLDEFEKAHPDILNLFLQVFDDGRLTDSLGRTVDFQNTVIIATSNAHSQFIKEEIERGVPIEKVGEDLKKKLTSIFRPELLNRFSDVIVFRNLNMKEIEAIAKIQLNDLAKNLKEGQGITLHFDEGAVRKLAELGYSPVFGARPLRQTIAEKIKSVLAEKILRKEVGRGTGITVTFDRDEFHFKINTTY